MNDIVIINWKNWSEYFYYDSTKITENIVKIGAMYLLEKNCKWSRKFTIQTMVENKFASNEQQV